MVEATLWTVWALGLAVIIESGLTNLRTAFRTLREMSRRGES